MMRFMLVAAAAFAAQAIMASEAVTLESLHREMQELKAEIRGLRKEMRTGGFAARHRAKGTNDVGRVQRDNRPPSDPEARKAWYAERRKAYEERARFLRERLGSEEGVKPTETTAKSRVGAESKK